MAKKRKMDRVDYIMAFESGELSEKDIVKLFQDMVNDGSVWSLQSSYGRTAKALLNEGMINYPKKKTTDYYGNPIPTKSQVRNKLKRKKK